MQSGGGGGGPGVGRGRSGGGDFMAPVGQFGGYGVRPGFAPTAGRGGGAYGGVQYPAMAGFGREGGGGGQPHPQGWAFARGGRGGGVAGRGGAVGAFGHPVVAPMPGGAGAGGGPTLAARYLQLAKSLSAANNPVHPAGSQAGVGPGGYAAAAGYLPPPHHPAHPQQPRRPEQPKLPGSGQSTTEQFRSW